MENKMTKKTRLIILLVCVASFFVIAPVLVAYSMGYRFDLENMKITSTGGIYVRSFPSPEQVIIDSKIIEKPGMFSNATFTQSLLPKDHTVLVKKTGYYDYFKTLPVEENQVTKIENVLLFKKNIQFQAISDETQSPFLNQDKYIIKNNNLYYSNVLENNGITTIQKATPVIKKLVAFALQNNNIVWLGSDGFLYRSDLTNVSTTPAKLILTPLKIIKTGVYKIITFGNNIFLNNNGSLLFLNDKTNELELFYSSIKDAKISPTGKNIIYYNDTSIYISSLPVVLTQKDIQLYKSSGRITNCLWLNNDYIIFTNGDKIIISEIDYRGNINTTTFPQTIIISQDQTINIKNPQIFFNQQEGKLYILTNDILLSSEKLIQ